MGAFDSRVEPVQQWGVFDFHNERTGLDVFDSGAKYNEHGMCSIFTSNDVRGCVRFTRAA